MFNNSNILITGGTGSFGTAFAKNILKKFKPKRLVIYSRGEDRQRKMALQFSKYKNIRFFIGDVRDKERLRIAINDIDYIIHAAALKQVPAAEYNPIECIKTNIQGAENIISVSLEKNVKKVIALSTDKAVNPVNLYGATKLASDKLFISANSYVGNKNLSFSVVRYGNVIGSTGSIIPIFLDINKTSKPFPITDKEMTRFWIRLDEAIDFVVNSFKVMRGGEIFVPKIPSCKIIDIAKAINPKKKLNYIGIRPGEKMHELMTSADESHLVLEFKKYFLITPTIINSSKLEFYKKDKNGEIGKNVEKDFSYNSLTNKNYLKINEIRNLIKKLSNEKY